MMSAYHESVTESLRQGAIDALVRAGAASDEIVVIRVPGAFEVPLAARKAAESGKFDALVCVGCIIRGETPHFDYLASAVANGISLAAQETGVPIAFGVLTTNSHEEAVERAGVGKLTRSSKGIRTIGGFRDWPSWTVLSCVWLCMN